MDVISPNSRCETWVASITVGDAAGVQLGVLVGRGAVGGRLPRRRRQLRFRVRWGVGLLVVFAGVPACASSSPATVNGSGATETSAADTTADSSTAVSVTAAGSGSGGGAQACSLLTAADLQRVFGGSAASGTLTTAPGTAETICTWTVTDSSGAGFGVELHIYPGASSVEFAQQRQAASSPTQDVTGLGDAAFGERAVFGENQVFDDLWVHAGTTSFRVEVLKDLGPTPLIPLAKTIINKLP